MKTETETRRICRREIPLGLAAPDHTVPYGTVSRGLTPRHFVPGYDRAVPLGQNAFYGEPLNTSSESLRPDLQKHIGFDGDLSAERPVVADDQ